MFGSLPSWCLFGRFHLACVFFEFFDIWHFIVRERWSHFGLRLYLPVTRAFSLRWQPRLLHDQNYFQVVIDLALPDMQDALLVVSNESCRRTFGSACTTRCSNSSRESGLGWSTFWKPMCVSIGGSSDNQRNTKSIKAVGRVSRLTQGPKSDQHTDPFACEVLSFVKMFFLTWLAAVNISPRCLENHDILNQYSGENTFFENLNRLYPRIKLWWQVFVLHVGNQSSTWSHLVSLRHAQLVGLAK